MTISESRFNAIADEFLEELADRVDEELGDALDVEMQEGIVTIAGEGGQYVINKHLPNRQIWLSSPVSGAWHFDYDEVGAEWVSTRGANITLTGLMSRELAAATGSDFSL